MNHVQKSFSITREDLAFNFAYTFDDVFLFSPFKSDTPTSVSGVRQSEDIGYDFQNECTPVIEIVPLSEEVIDNIGIDLSDILVNVTIEDFGLAIRKTIFSIPASDITETQKKVIDLTTHEDLSFHRGFEIKCFISRRNTLDPNTFLIWNKSQIIYQTNFIVKTSAEKALFEITWVDFSDESELKDLLYFVDWTSSEVTTEIDTDCFQVKANNKLKDQFKRLENNRHFGEFCIRLIAEQILTELIQQTLCNASIDNGIEPQIDSLHERLKSLLDRVGVDFDDLARRSQSTNQFDKMNVATEVTKILQKLNKIGSTLDAVKFGGYR